MNTVTTQTTKKHRKLGTLVLSALLAASIGGLAAAPARADNDDRGRYVQQERNDRARHPVRRTYRSEQPSYVYAPPPVYYVPPQRPAIDLVFPLNFR
jgi:hypothetical protein